MIRTHVIATAAFLVIGICVQAQKQFSGWLADFNTAKLNNRFSIHSDFQVRSSDKIEHLQTLLLRTGLNYHTKTKLIFTAGYAFIHNRAVVDGISTYANEHRIWEQLIINRALRFGRGANARKTSMQHRLRLEQRFIPSLAVSEGDVETTTRNLSNRLRYFLRNITPIIPWSDAGAAPFLAIQNEVFFNLTNKSAVNGKTFDQNRLYLALGYRFGATCDVEAGYLNQYINGRNDTHINNHIVQLATYLRL